MKKRIMIITAIGLLLALVAAGTLWYVVSTRVVEKSSSSTPTEPLSPYEKAIHRGVEAESKGDAKDALEVYKKARALCDEADAGCKADMDMKIKLMELALKQEGVKPSKKPTTRPKF